MGEVNTTLTLVEYRVRRVERFIVTRFEKGHDPAIEAGPKDWSASTTHGEFENQHTAYEVAYALCAAEHVRLGWLPGDERIQYPKDDPRYTSSAGKVDFTYLDSHPLARQFYDVTRKIEGLGGSPALTDVVNALDKLRQAVQDTLNGGNGRTPGA